MADGGGAPGNRHDALWQAADIERNSVALLAMGIMQIRLGTTMKHCLFRTPSSSTMHDNAASNTSRSTRH